MSLRRLRCFSEQLSFLLAFLLLSSCAACQKMQQAASVEHGHSKEITMPEADQGGAPQGKRPARPDVPEMIAATGEPFFLGPGVVRIALRLHAPAGPARDPHRGAGNVSLLIENVTCDKAAPTFAAYLNVPEGATPEDHPELFAGSMGMFGLPEASRIKGEHDGSGKGFSLDISQLFHTLQQRRDWNPRQISISFVPSYWDAPVPQVRVGRVSLYLQ